MAREFIYYSRSAPTSGNFGEDLMRAGRLDIAIHAVIAAFFLSHKMREDTTLHLVFAGMPDPVKHLEMKPQNENKEDADAFHISKKDIASLIKKMLYKYKEGKKHEVMPGYSIEKKSLLKLAEELKEEGRNLYILDAKGEDIREIDIKENPIFILGDYEGLPSKELRRLKTMATPVSIGKRTYFASQTVVIVNNELDRREDTGKL